MINNIYVVLKNTQLEMTKYFPNLKYAQRYSKKINGMIKKYFLFDEKITPKKYWKVFVYIQGTITNVSIGGGNYITNMDISKKKYKIDLNLDYWKLSKNKYEELKNKYNSNFESIKIAEITSYVSKEHCHKLATETWKMWLRRFIINEK